MKDCHSLLFRRKRENILAAAVVATLKLLRPYLVPRIAATATESASNLPTCRRLPYHLTQNGGVKLPHVTSVSLLSLSHFDLDLVY